MHQSRDADFRGENLYGKDLSNTDFIGSNFVNADACQANFEGSYLTDVVATGMKLLQANMDGIMAVKSDFTNSGWQSASAVGVDMTESVFTNCPMMHVNLKGSKLVKCVFNNAILDSANLEDCDLSGSVFINTALNGTKLKGAKLDGCVFYGSVLKNIDFTECEWLGANFVGAELIKPVGLPEECTSPLHSFLKNEFYLLSENDVELGPRQGAEDSSIKVGTAEWAWRNKGDRKIYKVSLDLNDTNLDLPYFGSTGDFYVSKCVVESMVDLSKHFN